MERKAATTMTQATVWQLCALEQSVRLALSVGKLDRESGAELLRQIEDCDDIYFEAADA